LQFKRKGVYLEGYNVYHDDILLIHLGGLGDMCLSESTFFSLSERFKEGVIALGYMRFLRLFERYFKGIERIESAKWLPLFSQNTSGDTWKRIIFIGKDREGAMRKRWSLISKEQMIFIEMYPDDRCAVSDDAHFGVRHVEDFQLIQLKAYGIEARKKEVISNLSKRVILYPEKGFEKKKWHYENFIKLYSSLKEKGIDVYILKSMGLEIDIREAIFFEELHDIKGFFEDGGIFVSNDSGMAHLAGMCGLHTITIFNDFDPDIWHPRGKGTIMRYGEDRIDVASVELKVMEALNGLTNVFSCNKQ